MVAAQAVNPSVCMTHHSRIPPLRFLLFCALGVLCSGSHAAELTPLAQANLFGSFALAINCNGAASEHGDVAFLSAESAVSKERDVQIRGYPVKCDIDVVLLFSANPSTDNRSGKVIPQLKDRIGAVIHTHYPRDRDLVIWMIEREAGIDTGGEWPGPCPRS